MIRSSHGHVWLALIGLLFACLICQAYPAMGETHHAKAAEPGCVLAGAAEAVPASTDYLLGGRFQLEHVCDDFSFTAHAPLAVDASGDPRAGPRPTPLSFRTSIKIYQLHRVYRL